MAVVFDPPSSHTRNESHCRKGRVLADIIGRKTERESGGLLVCVWGGEELF